LRTREGLDRGADLPAPENQVCRRYQFGLCPHFYLLAGAALVWEAIAPSRLFPQFLELVAAEEEQAEQPAQGQQAEQERLARWREAAELVWLQPAAVESPPKQLVRELAAVMEPKAMAQPLQSRFPPAAGQYSPAGR
jgi:hypothetical protein